MSDAPDLRSSLDEATLAPLLLRLHAVDAAPRAHGLDEALQPVQTLYEGAHHFDVDTTQRVRAAALAVLRRHAPDPAALGRALGIDDADTLEQAYARAVARLEERPLDDYRLDFEDGYGARGDAAEDAEAARTARAAARAARDGGLPDAFGIRIKPLGGTTGARGLRTLDVFVSTLVDAYGGAPARFVVTLPKVASPDQAAILADALGALEHRLGLQDGTLRFEMMVELPQIVLGPDGRSPLRSVLERGGGRMTAAHFGTYDYTAACGIAAAHQAMHHPACEFARQMMRVAFAGTGIWLSDGSTNVLPVEPRPDTDGEENRTAVHAAWRRHFEDVSESLRRGFYQGWDLHPAQLVTRWTALYVFFLGSFDAAAARLRTMLDPRGAGSGAAVLDDPATGQALLGFVRRAVRCGAIDEAEAGRATGLSAAELEGGGFSALLAARRS